LRRSILGIFKLGFAPPIAAFLYKATRLLQRGFVVKESGSCEANMRRHWQRFGKFYPASFQDYVNGILKKVEPHKAAHMKAE
jgi:hypothetical protein